MFRGFTLSRTTRTRSLTGSYSTKAPAVFLWIQTATPDMPQVVRPEYTIVWPSSVVKCPSPSHLTSDNPHTSTLSLIISSPSSWTFPSCSILRIFHVPSLSLLRSCSCLAWHCDIVASFITVCPGMSMVCPVTDFSTLPWFLDRRRGPSYGWYIDRKWNDFTNPRLKLKQ